MDEREGLLRSAPAKPDAAPVTALRTLMYGFVFVGAALTYHGLQQPNAGSAQLHSLSTTELSITQETAYTQRGDALPGSDYPWLTYLTEPYMVNTFVATGGSLDPSEATYLWTIEGTGRNTTGENVTFKCEHPNRFYGIKLWAVETSTGSIVESAEMSTICKYVRRELRTLTDDDREAFFEGMEILYSVDTKTGREKYGASYKSVQDFILIHNQLSGHIDCDHLHGGLGFLPQHAAMTYNFERSLQAVNPALTVPYWDYTIEGHAMTMANDSIAVWYLSRVWENSWFGQSSPEGYAVNKGRFAYTPVLTDAWSVSSVTNSYGLLRSPWNNNKIPYLTRHDKSYGFYTKTNIIPGCYDHADQMKMSVWSQFGTSIQYSPHGSLHILAGGTWGADYRFYLGDHYTYTEKRAQPLGTVTMARIWRKGWLTCPAYCSIDTALEDCKCTCPDLEDWISQNLTMTMLENMYPGLADATHFLIDDDGNDISEFFLRMLCNDDPSLTPQIGEFMESASPTDPIFWPTHPTLDRLWVWRKINGFTEEDWSNSSCWGHNEFDTTVWHVGFNESDPQQYTNSDLMTFFDPMLIETPYIYDNFEWPHCEKEGYNLQLIDDVTDVNTGDAPLSDATESLTKKKTPKTPVRGADDYAFLGWDMSSRGRAFKFDDPAPVPMR